MTQKDMPMKSYDEGSAEKLSAIVAAAGLTKEEWAELEPILEPVKGRVNLSPALLQELNRILKSLREQRRSLEKLNAQNLENALADERKRSAEQQQRITELSEALAKVTDDAAASSITLQNMTTQRDTARIELESLQRQYDAVKTYEKAAEFWGRKAAKHEDASNSILKLFGLLAAAFSIAVVSYHQSILGALPKTKDGDIGVAAIGVLFFLFLPALWALKLLSKFIIDHFLLTQDALERRTMMETFLSMIGNPNAAPLGEERLLILRSVFRPASGSQDDGAPITLLDAAKKLADMFKK